MSATANLMKPTKFDTHLVPLYRQTKLDGRDSRAGVLNLTTPELAKTFNQVRLDERKFGVVAKNQVVDDAAVGTSIQVELGDPATGLGLLADTFDDVLQFPRGRSVVPRFFWLEHGLAHTDKGLNDIPLFTHYKLVIALVSLLAKAAAYFDKDTEELVFLKSGKISLPVNYSASDLSNVSMPALETLLKQFDSSDKLQEQLLPILADAVIKHVCGLEPPRRFASLLRHLPEVHKDFDDGRRLYVSSFSYESVRSQLEADMLDELARINKTFAEVQGQILGIPVATVLVATQLKLTTAWGPEAWVNTSILIGVLVFVLLANFVMRNQLHTLDALAIEIKRKKDKVLDEYVIVKDIVSGTFPKLESRLKLQRLAFFSVQIILVLGFLAAVAMYLAMTEPAWQMLKRLAC
ncbi:MAG: hypothetical protein KA393_04665 [Limnohabitans sp.]|nr:hypothetical protein [Limnohabitans sp.]